MTTDRIHLFLNPTAGRGRAGRRQGRILELLATTDLRIEIHKSQAVGHLEELVRQQVDAGARRVIVAGGDGSVHEAVNGIMLAGFSAALGVIPTGTGNDFAKACNVPLNWEHATRLLADRIGADEAPRKIDIGTFNERFFANGAGIGFDAKVTHVARSIRWPIGDLVYLLAIFRAMLDGIATPRVQITTDALVWDGPLTLAAMSNGAWIGGMFHLAPMASNSDGSLDLLIAKPVTRRRILSLLPKLMSGDHMGEAEITHHSVTALEIQAEEAIPSHLDGEIQALQKNFKVGLLAGALNLL